MQDPACPAACQSGNQQGFAAIRHATDIMATGLGLILVAASINLAGLALWNFWIGLALLGAGWNFAFIGATTLVTECHDPHERNKVQAFNDFLIFGMMAAGSFSSGQLLANYGWSAVNLVVYPPVLLGLAVLALASLARRRVRPAVSGFPDSGLSKSGHAVPPQNQV